MKKSEGKFNKMLKIRTNRTVYFTKLGKIVHSFQFSPVVVKLVKILEHLGALQGIFWRSPKNMIIRGLGYLKILGLERRNSNQNNEFFQQNHWFLTQRQIQFQTCFFPRRGRRLIGFQHFNRFLDS